MTDPDSKNSTFTFDWHTEPESSFLRWVLVNLMVGPANSQQSDSSLLTQISLASDNFRKVQLGVTVNGFELDAESFLRGVERLIEWEANRAAKELVSSVPRFESIQEAVAQAEQEIIKVFRDTLRPLGIELDLEER
jgi:hypothetical protein